MTEPEEDASTRAEPTVRATGNPAVDAAAERLAALDDALVDEHVDIYDDVHRRLQEGLADLDET